MPTKGTKTAKPDPDVADEGTAKAAPAPKAAKVNPRIAGAYFSGGVWFGADGAPLSNVESQQAHRARDKELAEARRLALLGR